MSSHRRGARHGRRCRVSGRLVAGFAVVAVGAVAVGAGSCGYRFTASPELPGGGCPISIGGVENSTAEPQAGVVLRGHLARSAEAANCLGGGELRLAGRILRVSSAPEAFPGAVGSAGLYTLHLEAEAWIEVAGSRRVAAARASESEPFYAGPDPAETEANRRRALERGAARLAERLWFELTRPNVAPGT